MRARHVVLTGLAALVFGALASGFANAQQALHCTVILDVESGAPLYRKGDCEKRLPPASSFKLPLALMGFDAGILSGSQSPRWPYKSEYDAPKRDRKEVDPTIWEADSVLWYSREITRQLGAERFAGYAKVLGYGNEDVSGTPGKNDGLTHSWLSSSLQISGDEQAAFAWRLARNELAVSREAMERTRAIIPSFAASDGWTVKGKTGTTWLRKRNGSYDRTKPLGWFVGWAEKGERRIAFARVRVGSKTNGPNERAWFLKRLPGLLTKGS